MPDGTVYMEAAVNRVDDYMELLGVEEEDLGILVNPRYKQYSSRLEGKLLAEEDRYWEIYVNARDVSQLREKGYSKNQVDCRAPFEELEGRSEEFLEEVYKPWLDVFKEEFPEAEIQHPDLDDFDFLVG